MVKAIINNPYRILGVYSNSPKKEQIANKGKMQAFLRVGKSMPFPLDLKGILPPLERTLSLIEQADGDLALAAGQIKHAQFWFINKTPIDNVAFNHLLAGNVDVAMELWKKSNSLYSLQNLFVCSLIKGEYESAITEFAIPLYNQYAKVFVAEFDDKITISTTDLVDFIINELQNNDVDLFRFHHSIEDPVWSKLIVEKRLNPLISKLDSFISEAKSSRDKGPTSRLNSGNKLKIASNPLLNTLHSILSANDARYQIIADKIAQEVLQCAIDYYNETSDADSPVKALSLCEYALRVAVGTAAKQRCKENHAVIKKAADNMPPVEVAKEAKEIDSCLSWFGTQSKTSANGLELLKKIQKPLISIKEKVGYNNKYYLEISSTIASAALSYVIEEVNNAQKDDEPNPLSSVLGGSRYSSLYSINSLLDQDKKRRKAQRIKKALHDAWQTILCIDLLDTTEDFKNNRYKENRRILHSIINGLDGFMAPDDVHIIRGCAYGLKANKRFFWCDSEHFVDSKSKSDYKSYLEMFPQGNHTAEAARRIEEIKIRDRKILKFALIAIAIIAFILLMANM